MALYSYASSSKSVSQQGRSEFDILKASHKFLREDDGSSGNKLSWDEQLAKKYYSSLYREYAVCDLKHYKSGNFALRWRTESEVISGAGETTCGNTRCPLHAERENKFALVKVVLCNKCSKKLMWKRNQEKGQHAEDGKDTIAKGEDVKSVLETDELHSVRERGPSRRHGRDEDTRRRDDVAAMDGTARARHRYSRSRSPSRTQPSTKRRRSPPHMRTI
ncbi:folate-sensitive fragile site protein Fra10Ac1-domain-containing protein [Amylocystis lapponica]|nr:folate-sensitive fragile site protein Fra10Ac1-domain-containing protein [Amylocystis lapponica]